MITTITKTPSAAANAAEIDMITIVVAAVKVVITRKVAGDGIDRDLLRPLQTTTIIMMTTATARIVVIVDLRSTVADEIGKKERRTKIITKK